MVMMHSARHLEIVRALAEHRHFGRAAETLGISQPALSKGLNHIEETIGVRLFDRNGTVTPTEFGEIVLAHSGAILNGFFGASARAGNGQGPRQGQPAHQRRHLCRGGIRPSRPSAHFRLLHPNLRCALFVKDWVAVIDDVLNRSSHLGFADISDAKDHPDLETELVCEERLVVFVRAEHPLARRRQVSFKDMLEYPLGRHQPAALMARQFSAGEPSYG